MAITESRMLLARRIRAARTAGSLLPASPNIRSNTARGLVSRGIGVVSLRHEMFM